MHWKVGSFVVVVPFFVVYLVWKFKLLLPVPLFADLNWVIKYKDTRL